MAKSETGFIYFIRTESSDRVKIGYTEGSPKRRLIELCIGSSDNLVLEGGIPDGTFGHSERSLHKFFEEFHIRGEWFRREGNLALFIDKCVEGDLVLAEKLSTPVPILETLNQTKFSTLKSFRIPNDLVERMERQVENTGETASKIIVDSLYQYFDNSDKEGRYEALNSKAPEPSLTLEGIRSIFEEYLSPRQTKTKPFKAIPEIGVVEDQSESVPVSIPAGLRNIQSQQHSARCACFICKPPKEVVVEPKKKKWGKK
jgi:predicted DNA-binding protein